jgi:predicted O-methyltransferase YrrM
MDFINKELNEYVENHTDSEPALLKKLNRETYVNVLKPRMLSGHFQGRFLSMLSHMIKPLTVLEIGTYTGYSALCLAEGLQENGVIHTIDINEELATLVNKYIVEAGFEKRIIPYVGDAIEVIPTLNYLYDLVFIDADKINYLNYYNLVFDKVKKGGYIIADNVLWSGKVIVGEKVDKDTQAILDFNDFVHQDNRVENVLLPVRDGLMILRKL